jgi:uncharacterized protein YuzE
VAERVISVWFDQEGDFLEVMFERKSGVFRETDDDRVMEKVDADGNVIGFSITNVSKVTGKPLEVALR